MDPHDVSAETIYAHAGDAGLSFIFPAERRTDGPGGLQRHANIGHLSTIVGRGGSGKSILALQLVTQLLNDATKERGSLPAPAAFYFTLEASPIELLHQVRQFGWGNRYSTETTALDANDLEVNGLHLVEIPAPAASVNELCLRIRQTVARRLDKIGSLVAIVVDPIGAVAAIDELPTDFSKLRAVSESHRTFLFLLAEQHAFERHKSLEHYSQSIVHLVHDPKELHHRRLYVQKARGQSFRSGYHQFEIQPARESHTPPRERSTEALSPGIRVFPSLQAQSAYAHELLAERQGDGGPSRKQLPFFPNEPKDREESGSGSNSAIEFLPENEGIEQGSAVFLMGPPGTFKEYIATQFAQTATQADQATIYVSFKADYQAVKKHNDFANELRVGAQLRPSERKAQTYFLDARSPLLTPDEVLFAVRNIVVPGPGSRTDDAPPFGRAIIWGLRRLHDLPHFGESKAVQFLEALVTLLKSQQITSLLVDWPDRETNTVPIADLCQYIFLTRVAKTADDPDPHLSAETREGIQRLWQPSGLEKKTTQVAMLRVQRALRGTVHHDHGAVFRQFRGVQEPRRFSGSADTADQSFEHRWLHYLKGWEEDLSLLS